MPFPSQSSIIKLTAIPSETARLSIASSEKPSSITKTYREDRLDISFEYPVDWYLQEPAGETVDVLLTSYDPASPPHKLEWDDTVVKIGIHKIPPELAYDSLETWIEATKREAEETQLDIFSKKHLILKTGFPAAQITVVSGSGGILDYVLILLNEGNFEIIVQGNFALAQSVLDTLRLSK